MKIQGYYFVKKQLGILNLQMLGWYVKNAEDIRTKVIVFLSALEMHNSSFCNTNH